MIVPNTGNDKVMRVLDFPSVTTPKIRVQVNAARNHFSRVVELEAYACQPSATPTRVSQRVARTIMNTFRWYLSIVMLI